MVDLAFFDIFERTEYSDELYAVVGRALTVATHYDNNCKALANTLDIRENADLLDDKDKFQALLKKLSKRQLKPGIDKFTSTITTALRGGEIEEDIVDAFKNTIFIFLDEGRQARNFIAHELSLGLSEQTESEEFRQNIIEATKEQVSKVAKADYYIAVFIENHINKNHVNPSEEDYVRRIANWVCDTEN